MKNNLYVVFLGGSLPPNRIGEDHEIVFVVAKNQMDAEIKAKQKWQGYTNYGVHIDSIKKINEVDNYKLELVKIKSDEKLNKFFK